MNLSKVLKVKPRTKTIIGRTGRNFLNIYFLVYNLPEMSKFRKPRYPIKYEQVGGIRPHELGMELITPEELRSRIDARMQEQDRVIYPQRVVEGLVTPRMAKIYSQKTVSRKSITPLPQTDIFLFDTQKPIFFKII